MRQTAEKSQQYHLWAVAQLLTFTNKKKPETGRIYNSATPYRQAE